MATSEQINHLTALIKDRHNIKQKLFSELSKAIVGQERLLEHLTIALLANGHILLEGIPGLAKTLAIKSLAQAIQAKFSRIQFTPDLLPADVIGTLIYNQQRAEFVVRRGPIFANFVLADEINRAPAKVQSALLEAMQERQITIGDTTYKLEEPFLVLATQNPIEQEGTYQLPEAQVDRFLLKVVVTYPTMKEEQMIIRQNVEGLTSPTINPVLSIHEILEARKLVRQIYMDEKVEQYILQLVFATREPDKYGLDKLKPVISYGASPRGSISLALASKAQAFMNGRGYVTPEDVKSIAHSVLRHRIGLTYEAEAENITSENVVEEILKKVSTP
ncbi:MAG TPA: MoxR family ATPase [Flavisolibacter sp.]|jgi:MoxR-like ATPase|nr:MoxR family ATPase [Flavisolibacter sp.]